MLTRPSLGLTRNTVILREVIWPEPGEVTPSPQGLEISANYISRALNAAIEAGPLVGVCLIHTHPQSERGAGIGRFSVRDDWYEKRLFPTIVRTCPGAILVSVVLGSGGDVDARIWWGGINGSATQNVSAIRVVGPELSILKTPSSQWKDHADPKVMDRSTRLWGHEGRVRVQNLTIGIVGGGGTGSLAVFACSMMGVGKLRIWDKDTATKENRNRTVGVTSNFLGKPKVEALKNLAEVFGTADPFSIETYQDWGTSELGLVQLKDCDLIFCCVDKFAPRVPLNDLAYAHLIPVIDVASWIHFDCQHRVDALMTHAHVWSPGIPCAWCRETLTSYILTQEAQGKHSGVERRIPYGIPLDEKDDIEPSVLPLNMLGVSLALMEFMQVAIGITTRTPNDLKFFLPNWELDESDQRFDASCNCVVTEGDGETLPIRSVPME